MATIRETAAAVPQFKVDELEGPPLTLRQLTWRRFRRHKMAMFGSCMLLLLFVYCFGGALFISEAEANAVETAARLQPPSR